MEAFVSHSYWYVIGPVFLCKKSQFACVFNAGWADRVYYSDNGSTAVEIAIKMAFRKYLHDHNLLNKSSSHCKALGMKVQSNNLSPYGVFWFALISGFCVV